MFFANPTTTCTATQDLNIETRLKKMQNFFQIYSLRLNGHGVQET